jgi:GreA/GreB family transcription elongation factor
VKAQSSIARERGCGSEEILKAEKELTRRSDEPARKRQEMFTIVGVEELDFERDAVSWISPVGKALLAADMGDWIMV